LSELHRNETQRLGFSQCAEHGLCDDLDCHTSVHPFARAGYDAASMVSESLGSLAAAGGLRDYVDGECCKIETQMSDNLSHYISSEEPTFICVNGQYIPKEQHDRAVGAMIQLINVLPDLKMLMENAAQGLIDLVAELKEAE
jgi:hypothetical protein